MTTDNTASYIDQAPEYIEFDATKQSYDCYGLPVYEAADGSEWAIALNRGLATQAAKTEYRQTLWATKPDFLVRTSGKEQYRKVLQLMWDNELCEDANEAILDLLGDTLDKVLDDLIESDGIGKALADYDHEEVESVEFYDNGDPDLEDLYWVIVNDFELTEEQMDQVLFYRTN